MSAETDKGSASGSDASPDANVRNTCSDSTPAQRASLFKLPLLVPFGLVAFSMGVLAYHLRDVMFVMTDLEVMMYVLALGCISIGFLRMQKQPSNAPSSTPK